MYQSVHFLYDDDPTLCSRPPFVSICLLLKLMLLAVRIVYFLQLSLFPSAPYHTVLFSGFSAFLCCSSVRIRLRSAGDPWGRKSSS